MKRNILIAVLSFMTLGLILLSAFDAQSRRHHNQSRAAKVAKAPMPASSIVKQTYTFAVEGNDTLKMDVYHARVAKPGPALIFAFGGAFTHGSIDDPRYVPFFKFMAQNGVTVISTGYRTLLKGISIPSGPEALPYFVKRLVVAVKGASADYCKGTAFVLEHCAEWNIDPQKIFACGSSAGAITALQTEYALVNQDIPGFPQGWNYAGVISFAGSIFSEGPLVWKSAPAPMAFFHGDADCNVPFGELTFSGAGLYGPEPITKSLDDAKVPYWFNRFNGSDHDIAISAMNTRMGEVLDFIHSIIDGKPVKVESVQTIPGMGAYKTRFTIEDYIKANL